MLRVIGLTGAMVIAVLACVAGTKPAEAQVVYPWCAHYQGRDMGGAPNCGFTSYAQCMATVSGIGGWCGVNPWYEPGPPPRARRR